MNALEHLRGRAIGDKIDRANAGMRAATSSYFAGPGVYVPPMRPEDPWSNPTDAQLERLGQSPTAYCVVVQTDTGNVIVMDGLRDECASFAVTVRHIIDGREPRSTRQRQIWERVLQPARSATPIAVMNRDRALGMGAEVLA